MDEKEYKKMLFYKLFILSQKDFETAKKIPSCSYPSFFKYSLLKNFVDNFKLQRQRKY